MLPNLPCATLVLLAMAAPALAAEVTDPKPVGTAPPSDAVAAAVGGALPAFWRVRTVTVTASVNAGDAVEPNVKQRIEADIEPTTDLYVEDPKAAGRYATFIGVLPTAAAKSPRKLYAVLTATYRAGQWRLDVRAENGVDDLGKPADLFPRPIVVEGSEDEAKLIDRIKTAAARQAEVQVAILQEDLKAKLQAATANAQQEREIELARLRQQNEKDIAKAKADLSQAQSLVDIERQKQTAIADLARSQKETAEKAAALAAQRHQSDMEQAARKIADDADLRQAQAKADQELAARRAQRIQEIKTVLAGTDVGAALTAFQRALADPDEVLRTVAMNAALASTVPEIGQSALRQVIARSKTLAIDVDWWKDNDEKSQQRTTAIINLQITGTELDGDVIRFQGTWSSSLFRRWQKDESYRIRGSLSGGKLNIQTQNLGNGCGIDVRSPKVGYNTLSGIIDCADVVLNTHPNYQASSYDLHSTATINLR